MGVKISESEFGIVRSAVRDLPAVVPQQFTNRIFSMRTSYNYLPGALQKHSAGKRFTTEADAKQAVTPRLQTFYINFFYSDI